MNPAFLGSTHNRPPAGGGGGGSNIWYDSISDTSSADGTLNASGPSFMEWSPVTVGASGTADQLRIFVHQAPGGGANFKLALFDGSKNLIVASAAGSMAATVTNAYVTLTIANTAISAGSFFVGFEADKDVVISTKGSTLGSYKSNSYSSFPPSNLGTEDGHVGEFFVSIHLQ